MGFYFVLTSVATSKNRKVSGGGGGILCPPLTHAHGLDCGLPIYFRHIICRHLYKCHKMVE